MRESLNSDTLFNTVAMVRQNVSSLILVLEGDDDHHILKAHNTQDLYLVLGVGGKTSVLEAASLAERRGLTGVKFLIDSDYDKFFEPIPAYPSNVFASMYHDLIMDIAIGAPETVHRVIEAHSRTAERKGATIAAAELSKNAMSLAACVAPLRVANERHRFGLKLKEFPFNLVAAVAPSHEEITRVVIARSKTDLSEPFVAQTAKSEERVIAASHESTVGDHDYFRALARLLKKEGVVATAGDIFTSFLATLGCRELIQTNIYSVITQWAAANGRVAFHCPYPR